MMSKKWLNAQAKLLVLVGALGLAVAGCGDDPEEPADNNANNTADAGPDATEPDTGPDASEPDASVDEFARVQVLHNAADPAADTVDVFANGEVLIDDFDFRTATPFVDVPAGVDLTIALAAPDSADGDADTTLDDDDTVFAEFAGVQFMADMRYIVTASGVAAPDDFAANPDGETIGLDLKVSEVARESAESDEMVDVLVLHGATDIPNVDITVDNAAAPQVEGLTYGSYAGYLSVEPGVHTVDVAPEGVAPLYFQTPDLPAGSAFTVAASGFFDPSANQDGPAAGLFAFPATGGDAIELAAAARLQIIHASPDTNAAEVDVYANDQLLLDNFGYLSASPFVTIPSGADLAADVTASDADDNANPVYSQTIPGSVITPGSTWVAIASGIVGDNFMIRPGEAAESAPAGEVALNIFHGVPDAPNVDVTADSGAVELATDLPFGDFSGLAMPAAADINIVVAITGGAELANFAAPLSALDGQYATAVARGTADDTDDTDFGVTAFTADGTVVDLTQ